MQIYLSPVANPNKTIYVYKNIFGFVFTPRDCRYFFPFRHIIDNGAYHSYINNKPYDINPFLKLLDVDRGREPDFVVIPDIVAGGLKSLEYSIQSIDKIPKKFKRYLVVQDGIQPYHIADCFIAKEIDGFFVGGTKEWKLRNYELWCNVARSYRLPCHIGRFGNYEKLLMAYKAGADSVDSSNFSQHDSNWNQLLDFYHGINPDVNRL